MENLKIAWHDSRIYNRENSSYIKTFPFTYELRAFSEVEETIRFLQSENNPWVLVTSGRNGEALASRVCDNPNVIGIIIFCMNRRKNKKLLTKYPKVKEIVTRGFHEVLDHASNIFNTYVAHTVSQLNEDPSVGMVSLMEALNPIAPLNQINSPDYYYHMQNELEMSFLMVIKLTLKNRNISRRKVLAELLALNPSRASEVKNVFNQNRRDLLKSIIYTYSSNLVYRQLNECYASNNYHKVMNITAACMCELQARSSFLMLQEETVLYRGVDIPENQLIDYQIGQLGFWSAFTSTTTNEAVSRSPPFGGNVQFEIHLSKTIRHPHIVLESGWSMHNRENEVLLLPYFPFKITDIEDLGNYKKIIVHQNEAHLSLSLDSQALNEYWLNRFINEVSVPFYNLCEQIHHRIAIYVDYRSYFYIQNREFQGETNFQIDLQKAICKVYRLKIMNKSFKTRLDSSASIINYWGILKEDIINDMGKDLRKKIKDFFAPDFINMRKSISKVMNEEMISTFEVPLNLLYQCIQPIFNEVEKNLIQSAPNLHHNSMQDSDGYIEFFCRKVVIEMGTVMAGQKLNIDHTTEAMRIKLNEQLEKLKTRIAIVLGEIIF
ncbi:unnamed protein product [Blepharisma stoltei]|uniref:NAD(+)--protein-arginine ADP-ribosyltransferase n=1 Tax=Blepharisma stoltei TaxID=1481888 RepID=A0AAU9K7E8_9CILI|nr:unnamed protein product [Blepharisma stoltei]